MSTSSPSLSSPPVVNVGSFLCVEDDISDSLRLYGLLWATWFSVSYLARGSEPVKNSRKDTYIHADTGQSIISQLTFSTSVKTLGNLAWVNIRDTEPVEFPRFSGNLILPRPAIEFSRGWSVEIRRWNMKNVCNIRLWKRIPLFLKCSRGLSADLCCINARI